MHPFKKVSISPLSPQGCRQGSRQWCQCTSHGQAPPPQQPLYCAPSCSVGLTSVLQAYLGTPMGTVQWTPQIDCHQCQAGAARSSHNLSDSAAKAFKDLIILARADWESFSKSACAYRYSGQRTQDCQPLQSSVGLPGGLCLSSKPFGVSFGRMLCFVLALPSMLQVAERKNICGNASSF